jgi:hypothetical protein
MTCDQCKHAFKLTVLTVIIAAGSMLADYLSLLM